jgi:hypothetical protein
MISLFSRFGTSIRNQFIGQANAFRNEPANELLDISDGRVARSDPKLAIDHFHDNGIANLEA